MMSLKVVTIVGARPQFIKAAAVSRAIVAHNAGPVRRSVHEVLVHTGQHYDHDMSAVFFAELGLPEPAHNLGVGSGTHGAQTGEMLGRIEEVLLAEPPDVVLVYGDTNTTLAGALAAAKLHVPIAHVEAGLRSFDRRMPEEVNRVLTDHLADYLFCPSTQSVENLAAEGIHRGVHRVGDVMQDVLRWHLPPSARQAKVIEALGCRRGSYAVATVHRAANTDDVATLTAIFSALERLATEGLPVVVPTHPRTRKALQDAGVELRQTRLVAPVSYEEMLCLEANARVILTDSGGMQKEAYWLGVPCVTLREETEWTETVDAGWNVLVGCDPDRIVAATRRQPPSGRRPRPYGSRGAAARIVARLVAS